MNNLAFFSVNSITKINNNNKTANKILCLPRELFSLLFEL